MKMKSKKLFALIICLIVISLLPVVYANQKILVIDITVFKVDKVELHRVYLDEGVESSEFTTQKGNYKAVLFDEQGKKLFEKFLKLDFKAIIDIFPGQKNIPEEIELDKTRLLLKMPYFDRIAKFQLLKEGKVIFETKIDLCNDNGVCESNKDENHLSCPNDCVSGTKDNYCDRVLDGICDVDCAIKELDIDCTCGNNICDERENEKTCKADCKLSLWQRIVNFLTSLFQ